jgi:drug/metabolite transporter (DMT)-like permease
VDSDGSRTPEGHDRTKVLLAFAAIYLIWGSTYLAIRYAIETMPPFLMAGARFFSAGLLLFAVMLLRERERPQPVHWRSAAIIGGLLLLGGNGAVVWAEQRVPSGVASLFVATVPLWVAVFGRTRPDPRVIGGIVLGFLGIAVLLGPAAIGGGEPIDPLGAGVVLAGALSWAIGSLYSRKAPSPRSPLLAVAMQMMMGGLLQLLAGTLSGEWDRVRLDRVSQVSFYSFLYLLFFGSLVGYTAYVWLLRRVAPSKAATYAYVNPIVAVLLGWGLGGEALGFRTMVAACVIVAAVVLITSRGSDRAAVPKGEKDPGSPHRAGLAERSSPAP